MQNSDRDIKRELEMASLRFNCIYELYKRNNNEPVYISSTLQRSIDRQIEKEYDTIKISKILKNSLQIES